MSIPKIFSSYTETEPYAETVPLNPSPCASEPSLSSRTITPKSGSSLSEEELTARALMIEMFGSDNFQHVNQVFEARNLVLAERSFYYQAKESFPPLVVQRKRIVAVGSRIGKGGNNSVHSSVIFPLVKTPNSSPSKPKTDSVLKIPIGKRKGEEFIAQQGMMKTAVSPMKQKGMDAPLRTMEVLNLDQIWSEHTRYDTTLKGTIFQDVHHAFLLAISFLTPLESMHRKGFIHGDLKGANIGVNGEEALLSDLDTLGKPYEEDGKLTFTLDYIDPHVFESLSQQYHLKKGRLTIESDVFALGRVLELDIVYRLIIQNLDPKVKDEPVVRDARSKIHMTRYMLTDDIEQDLEYCDTHFPGKCVYSLINKKIYLYCDPKERFEAIKVLIAHATFSEIEKSVLENLAACAIFSLQNPDLPMRGNTKEALDLIKELAEQLVVRPTKRLKEEVD